MPKVLYLKPLGACELLFGHPRWSVRLLREVSNKEVEHGLRQTADMFINIISKHWESDASVFLTHFLTNKGDTFMGLWYLSSTKLLLNRILSKREY